MSKTNLNKKHSMCRKTNMLTGNTESIVFLLFLALILGFK